MSRFVEAVFQTFHDAQVEKVESASCKEKTESVAISEKVLGDTTNSQ
jgi:hypothetical protein